VGIPMMVAEFSLGRSGQRNVVGAFSALTGKVRTHWRKAGFVYWIMAGFFLSWYAVVSGWVLRYVFASATGAYFDDPAGYFQNTSEGPDTLFWHLAVLILTLLAVMGGIAKGIERVNFVMMPLLFLMIIGLAIYAATLANATAGYQFYLRPDFSQVNLAVFTAAIGQAFFSLSLGQGAMFTYASYLPRTSSLAANAAMISFSTLGFAIMCGFMVFPMLAAFNLLDTGAAGLGLIFGPLPMAFAQMGPGVGQFVGTLFFLATFFAAFTSAISLTEPGVAYFVEERGFDRRRAALLMIALIYTAGIAVAFSVELLDIEGGALTDASVILGGLIIALYVGWFSPQAKARERMDESDRGLRLSFYVYPLVKFVMPVVLTGLLIFALFGTPCALGGDPASNGLLELMFGRKLLGCSG
jgi:neurotransmitter:Na+ symporter, NSS family